MDQPNENEVLAVVDQLDRLAPALDEHDPPLADMVRKTGDRLFLFVAMREKPEPEMP